MRALILCLSFVTLLSSFEANAAVQVMKDTRQCQSDASGCYAITGFITRQDAAVLDAIAAQLAADRKAAPTVWLDSPGGDLAAGIAIGRSLRKVHARAQLDKSAVCLSACVLVLAGATQRSIQGRVGIHRPFAVTTEARSYDAVQAEQRRLRSVVETYLDEMNISRSLFDAMLRVPPEKMQLLSEDQLAGFGMLKVDPAEQELADAEEARKYGLSKIQLMQRRARADSVCAQQRSAWQRGGSATAYEQCRAQVMDNRPSTPRVTMAADKPDVPAGCIPASACAGFDFNR